MRAEARATAECRAYFRQARRVNAQHEFCITPRQQCGKRGSQRNARVVVPGDHRARPALAVTRDDEGVFMRRSWTALAVALSAIFAAIGCNDYGNTFQVPTGATITSLSPANITAGSAQFTLTVNGGGFVAQTVVQWNGGTVTDHDGPLGRFPGRLSLGVDDLTARRGEHAVQAALPGRGRGHGRARGHRAAVTPIPRSRVICCTIDRCCGDACSGSSPRSRRATPIMASRW